LYIAELTGGELSSPVQCYLKPVTAAICSGSPLSSLDREAV